MKNFLSKFGLALVAFIATFTIIGCGDSGDGLDSLEKFEPKDELDKIALAVAKEKYPDVEIYNHYDWNQFYSSDNTKTWWKKGKVITKQTPHPYRKNKDYLYNFVFLKDKGYYIIEIDCKDNQCGLSDSGYVEYKAKKSESLSKFLFKDK